MEDKDKLTLFLISRENGVKDIFNLIKIFDRATFPGMIGKSIDRLLNHNLIVANGLDDNGNPVSYEVTDEGKKYITENFKGHEILKYISGLDNPSFLYELTELHISAANDLQQKL